MSSAPVLVLASTTKPSQEDKKTLYYYSTNIGDYKGSEQILTSYSIDANGNITYSGGTYSDRDN